MKPHITFLFLQLTPREREDLDRGHRGHARTHPDCPLCFSDPLLGAKAMRRWLEKKFAKGLDLGGGRG